jgi:hypothetical protein
MEAKKSKAMKTCTICNITITSSSFAKHLRSTSHLEKSGTTSNENRTTKTCTICNITMNSSSFAKHLKSALHIKKVAAVSNLPNENMEIKSYLNNLYKDVEKIQKERKELGKRHY